MSEDIKMQSIDCTGLNCPQPVILTKNALEQGAEQLLVIVDNVASRENVTRFARSRQCEVTVESSSGGCFQLIIRKGDNPVEKRFDPADYACAIPAAGDMVYVISSDSMGRGSDELGWALLQTYIQTIEQVDPLPSKIIFYNSGVKLVAGKSGALDALIALQQKGVEILACGTCLDFFQLKSEIKIGHISNMHEIMTAMTEAGKLVSPL